MGSTPHIDYKALAKEHGAVSSVRAEDVDNTMPDYSDVPQFLKDELDMGKVRQVEVTPQDDIEKNSIAEENPKDPYTIKVLASDLYGPPILTHELTHTYQDTRAHGIVPSAPIIQSGRAAYDYGGVQGLQAARTQGKTISDFNAEQQAEIVKDYKVYHDQFLKKAAEGKITPAEEKQMYDLQQAYHPFIKQLAAMPGASEKIDRNALLELVGFQKPAAIDTKPEPPGLPPYNTPGLGILPADPLMGGRSQPTPTLDDVKKKAAKLKPAGVK